jgi:hypothetical protein
MQQKNTLNVSAQTNDSWTEFRYLCLKMERMSHIPFRIVDARDNVIYQTEKRISDQANGFLTLHCRHQQKTYFRIICEAEDKDPQQVLDLMFALKKIGLDYQSFIDGKEALHEEIARNYRFLHFFYSLPSLLSGDTHRNRLCQTSLERICKILNVERGSIFLYHSGTRSFQLVAVFGKTFFKPELARLNIKILQWLRDKNRPLLIEDVNQYPLFKGKGDYRTRSFISSPIYFHPSMPQKRIAGVINLSDPVGRQYFTSHDLRFVSSAASYAVFLSLTKPEQKTHP